MMAGKRAAVRLAEPDRASLRLQVLWFPLRKKLGVTSQHLTFMIPVALILARWDIAFATAGGERIATAGSLDGQAECHIVHQITTATQ